MFLEQPEVSELSVLEAMVSDQGAPQQSSEGAANCSVLPAAGDGRLHGPIQLSSALNYHCTHCQAQDQILAFTLLHQVEKKILIAGCKLVIYHFFSNAFLS